MSLYDQICLDVLAITERIKQSVADDGLSVPEAIGLGHQAVESFVKLAQQAGGTGAEKKEAVLEAIYNFYDQVIVPMDAPGPDVLVDPLLRSVILPIYSYVIDTIVTALEDSGDL